MNRTLSITSLTSNLSSVVELPRYLNKFRGPDEVLVDNVVTDFQEKTVVELMSSKKKKLTLPETLNESINLLCGKGN